MSSASLRLCRSIAWALVAVALGAGCRHITPPPEVTGPVAAAVQPGPKPGLAAALDAHVKSMRGPGYDVLFPAGVTIQSVDASTEGVVRIDFSDDLLVQPVRLDTADRLAQALRPVVDEYRPGARIEVTADGKPLDLMVPRPHGGHGPARDRAAEIPPPPGPALVRPFHSAVAPSQGLEGRHIALWHSHGWYYSEGADRWEWQRPRMFTTVEDKLPMSFVLPYLVPMLENAGAVAFLPRERDFQPHEVVVDDESGASLSGDWSLASDPGFRAGIDPLPEDVNPFDQGHHHVAQCGSRGRSEAFTSTWTPDIPADGDYAVCVSYGAAPDRAPDALYTVRHTGGISRYLVNQRMGGHTWVYLGTFTFRAGRHPGTGSVLLEATSETPGATVSADAVRFGGGMGNIPRGGRTSGYPRVLEGAKYFIQYAGAPANLTYRTSRRWDDYDQDYACRPEWVNWLRGAPCGPNRDRSDAGEQIPIDLAFAFHTDAGIRKDIFGTLMIYRLPGEGGGTVFPDGRPRWLNRELGDLIQTQIVEDIRAEIGPEWTRRQLQNRSLAEPRRPNVPSCLLELASHQNFPDQQSLEDPRFRFLVSRAIYKGMLRFIAAENGFDPVVEPLPPTHLRVEARGHGRFHLSWQPQSDPLEPTAEPTGYLVYHREGGPIGDRWLVARGGGFGEPVFTASPSLTIEGLDSDAVHSFRVAAVNVGGESFPSTTLAAAWGGENAPVALVVDAFDRVGPPAVVAMPGSREGFDRSIDRGVSPGADHSLTGDQTDFDPTHAWQGNDTPWNNDNPGHGASLPDLETRTEVGNLFDHAALHAEPLHALGYTVNAITDEALQDAGWPAARPALVDWILGEERTTPPPLWAKDAHLMHAEFQALPSEHRQLIRDYLAHDGRLILSGANWASDLAEPVAGVEPDEDGIRFLHETLGAAWIKDQATTDGRILASPQSPLAAIGEGVAFETGLGEGPIYGCESPDAINATTIADPVSPERKVPAGTVVLRYADGRTGAAVLTQAPAPGRAVSLGFPLECIADGAVRERVFRALDAQLRHSQQPSVSSPDPM
jgi:hypothetical protein